MDVPLSETRMGAHQCPRATEPVALPPILFVRHLPCTRTADAVRTLCRFSRTAASRSDVIVSEGGQVHGVARARGAIGGGACTLVYKEEEHARRNSPGE
jgi:hypothetical protein